VLGGGRGGDDRPGAPARREPALGGQLLVRVGHDAARDAELRGEGARRGQPDPGAQPPGADRVPQLAGQLPPQRLPPCRVERHEQRDRLVRHG
jgi:hypothetical protein